MNRQGIIRGWKGEGKPQAAVNLRKTMTPTETRLWEYLRANRLAGLKFRRQQPIDGFIADFYCHAAGLVVELDGAVHHHTQEYDQLRDQIIAARGLLILRFPNDEVEQATETVLEKIRQIAEERIATIGHSREE
jgi:very-short-patch-repair endonuclease